MLWVIFQSGVIWGHWGSKRSFSLKMLQFVHVTQHEHKTHTSSSALDPLPMLWVKCQSGVIWGHRGQEVIFPKNVITRPCYIARPYDSCASA